MKTFVDLMKLENPDRQRRQELETAEIDIVEKVDTIFVVGVLGGENECQNTYKNMAEIEKRHSFVFVRDRTCWIVNGYMPLEIAVKIHSNPIGRDNILAAGHEGYLHPKNGVLGHKIAGKKVIPFYHIYNQEALNLFTKTIKQHHLV